MILVLPVYGTMCILEGLNAVLFFDRSSLAKIAMRCVYEKDRMLSFLLLGSKNAKMLPFFLFFFWSGVRIRLRSSLAKIVQKDCSSRLDLTSSQVNLQL